MSDATRAGFLRRARAILTGSAGNLVEWYDFYAYAAFSLYFAPAFFPGNEPLAQQLNAALLFAFGFIARPLGGAFFGHFGDRMPARCLSRYSPPTSTSAWRHRCCSAARGCCRDSAWAANTAPAPPT